MSNTELASSLRSSISKVHKRLRKQSAAAGSFSITELETIGYLYRMSSLLPSELATLARVKTQSMSQILNKIEELQLIKRTPSKEDGRKVYISLTAHGKRMVEQTRYERDSWLVKAIAEACTAQEQALLAKVVPVLEKIAAID